MKIKNSSQVVSHTAPTTTSTTSANLVPVSFTSSAIHSLNVISLSEPANTSAANPSMDDEHSASPNQILTRSAAVRAQLSKSLKPSEPHRRHSHHQHVIGKIVKPIPVRPVSSSSSSSSTHSSHHHHAAQHRHAKTSEHLLANLYEMSALPAPPPPHPNENFSLIAKYFASFPATRLKTNASPPTSSSPVFEQQQLQQQQQHNELFKSLNKQSISSNKSTPFLPFKKASTASASSTASLAAAPLPHTGFSANFIAPPVDAAQTSGFNLRSHAHGHAHSHGFNVLVPLALPLNASATTDNLCTHFKRMIKLNDCAEEASLSPQTATSNTPTGLLDSDETNESTSSSTGAVVDYASASSSSAGAPRFGQITMETRLTRKFLIKHHPYLQISSVAGQQQQQQHQARPSIDLIKMKKLICASAKEAECSNDNEQTPKAGTSPVLLFNASKSGRTSRAANQAEDKLVKFTDKFSAEPSASPLGPKRRQSVLSKQPASGSSSSSSSKAKHASNSEWSYLDFMYGKDEADLVDDDEIDDSQEDSSGYYSSYHSVDLISSSGGSSGGDLLISRQSKLNGLITGANKPNDAKSQQQQHQQQQIPHHHYHTRYLSNYLQQNGTSAESSSPSGSASRNRSATPNSKQASLASNTPTTRLRHQQQLAAAAAAKTSGVKQHQHHDHSQQHDLGYVECDLDLDQIEND